MTYYTCRRAMLPTVEAALAADGYRLELPLTKARNGDRITIMTRGAAIVLLAECAQSDLAAVEVLGNSPDAAITLLDELPAGLVRRAKRHELVYQ